MGVREFAVAGAVIALVAAACASGSESLPEAEPSISNSYDLTATGTQLILEAVGGPGGEIIVVVEDAALGGAELLVAPPSQIEQGTARRVLSIPEGQTLNAARWLDNDRAVVVRQSIGEPAGEVLEVDVRTGEVLATWTTTVSLDEIVYDSANGNRLLVGNTRSGSSLSIVDASGPIGVVAVEQGDVQAQLCADGSAMIASLDGQEGSWTIEHADPSGDRQVVAGSTGGMFQGFDADPSCDRLLIDASFGGVGNRQMWLADLTEDDGEIQALDLRVGHPSFVGEASLLTLGTAGVETCDLPCST